MEDLLTKLRIYGPLRFIKYALYEIYLKIWMQGVKGSFSQAGEDIAIDKILGNKKRGFYIDVGANDPTRFSNTKRFYLKGWQGINIEPDPQSFEKLIRERRRDINLNVGIGEKDQRAVFYKFIPNTISTFSKRDAKTFEKQGYELVNSFEVPVLRLSSVLKKHAKGKKVDFFSVDTEGHDLEVLKNNDWKRFRPKVICVEASEHGFFKPRRMNKDVENFLLKLGYEKVFDNITNSIYVLKKSS